MILPQRRFILYVNVKEKTFCPRGETFICRKLSVKNNNDTTIEVVIFSNAIPERLDQLMNNELQSTSVVTLFF